MITKCIIDFDGCIADSIKSITKSFEVVDALPEGTYDPSQVKRWNFVDIIPHATDSIVEKLFESQLFWDDLELMDGVKEFVDEFREHIIICSIGGFENQIKKLDWIREHLGDVSCLPVVTNMSEYPKRIGKHMVNMENCLLVEDTGINIDRSNCEVGILFNNYGNWDAEWSHSVSTDYKATTWKEVGDIVREYLNK